MFVLFSIESGIGLRLFRQLNLFRILVCSRDGSVGWVLNEIDKSDTRSLLKNMQVNTFQHNHWYNDR
ncbi:unnamed protein product [Hermetia illucens]|uniref:Uncharacterized protein n=1 Tax=Hermetia illucens TaxID=343691 RepID=A0A7R8V0T0_HERIL|nr:unnamed protein product [Hermetia illucens]